MEKMDISKMYQYAMDSSDSLTGSCLKGSGPSGCKNVEI